MNTTASQTYIKVPFAELQDYLHHRASAENVNYIEITDIEAESLSSDTDGSYFGYREPSSLGSILRESGRPVALKLPKTIKNLQSMKNCFIDCTALISLAAIPAGVADISCCFTCCGSLTKAPIIPAGVMDMYGCFFGCESLAESPLIPNSVTNMTKCFRDCKNLTHVQPIPTGVTDMRDCFAGCKSLMEAPAIPESVTNCIGCFRGCEHLELSRMPKGCKRIEDCFSTGRQKLLQFLLER